jgi:hypothetical protein
MMYCPRLRLELPIKICVKCYYHDDGCKYRNMFNPLYMEGGKVVKRRMPSMQKEERNKNLHI